MEDSEKGSLEDQTMGRGVMGISLDELDVKKQKSKFRRTQEHGTYITSSRICLN